MDYAAVLLRTVPRARNEHPVQPATGWPRDGYQTATGRPLDGQKALANEGILANEPEMVPVMALDLLCFGAADDGLCHDT